MRILVVLFIASFVVSLIALAYLFGQKSVDVNVVSYQSRAVSCLKVDAQVAVKETLSFPLISDSKAASPAKITFNADLDGLKESIDTTVIHAIRDGKWSEQDNRVFLSYISELDKKDRIFVLKQMNQAINYQQMRIGSYIPNF